MNLKPRFLLLTGALFLFASALSWFTSRTLAEQLIGNWALRYAEKQVLYDKIRTLAPITRELALARQLASAPLIRDWASRPDDPALTSRALAELERLRPDFIDRSYFVALAGNGRYYFNNESNEFAGRQLRYVLDRDRGADGWFFDLLRQQRDVHINVNPDVHLGITRLWVNVLIRDGGKVLGIVGTGFDLSRFLDGVVDERMPGVTSLFVDHAGAIQLHRDKTLIDYGSIAKGRVDRNTIDLVFDRPEDREVIRDQMRRLEADRNGREIQTGFVQVDGRRHLAGIAYLPEIEWFEVTLLDLDMLLPLSDFYGIAFAFVGTLLLAVFAFNIALNHHVIGPLRQLDQAMARFESGEPPPDDLSGLGAGEVRSLMQRFGTMARHVLEGRHELERKVQERTLALERLTRIDPLTELLNRRGMAERLDSEIERARRDGTRVGILWIDLDRFKDINDLRGHRVGDDALRRVADIIRGAIRPYDVASRWGGDEFLILLHPANDDMLERLALRLCAAVRACVDIVDAGGEVVALSISIGGHVMAPGEDPNLLLHRSDQALYAAKAAGRDRYAAFDAQAEPAADGAG